MLPTFACEDDRWSPLKSSVALTLVRLLFNFFFICLRVPITAITDFFAIFAIVYAYYGTSLCYLL